MSFTDENGTVLTPDACSPGRAALRQQFHLRNTAILATALGVWAAAGPYRIAIHVPELLFGIAMAVLINLRTWQRLREAEPVTQWEFLRPLVLDLLVLTYMFYFTGGAHNPFQGLFLIPLAIAAARLDWRCMLIVLAATMGCFTLLHFQHLDLVMADGTPVPAGLIEAAVYLNYLVTAGTVALLVSRISAAARTHAAALARAREQQLNDHFIVGFGALAAGAAHELATPLSVMAVLVKEMRKGRGDLKESLDILGSQVEACKQTLRQLSEVAGETHVKGNASIPLDRFLSSVAERFRMLRPGARLLTQWEGLNPAPLVRSDPALAQSLLSLLNNAADASDQPVEMRAYLYGDSLKMEVADRGKGVAPEIAGRLGAPFVTSKPGGAGMGLGVFLTRTIIDRLGGSMDYRPRPEGGTCVEVTLPMILLREV